MTDQNQQAELPPLEWTEEDRETQKPLEFDAAGMYIKNLNQICRERQLRQALHRVEILERENLKKAQLISWTQGIADAANRRAEEAFNEGVEAAAEFTRRMDFNASEELVWNQIRNLKRPTQPEQTQKEQGR